MDSKDYGIKIMKEISELFDRLLIQERDFFIGKLIIKCSIRYNEKHIKTYKK